MEKTEVKETQKVAIQVEEKITYEEEYTVEQPADMNDNEFDIIVSDA